MYKLSDEEIKQIVETFYQVDSNSDNLVSIDEAFTLFERMNLVPSPEKLMELIEKCKITTDVLDKREILQVAKLAYQEKIDSDNASKPIVQRAQELARKFTITGHPVSENVIVEIKEEEGENDSDYEYYTYSSGDEEDNTKVPLISADASGTNSFREKKLGPNTSKTSVTTSVRSDSPLKNTERETPKVEKINRSKTRERGRKIEGSKAKNEESKSKKKANLLSDPKVRKQLAKIKAHDPLFLKVMTFVQVAFLGYAIYRNGGFESVSLNPFLGPTSLTLIQLGAKYTPCMRANASQPNVYVSCNPNYPNTSPKAANGTCLYYDNLAFECGMNGFSSPTKPDQIWRFVTPLFLHTGIIHLIFNLLVQIRVGYKLESQIGSINMAILYFISGVGGYILAALLSPEKGVSVGSSSSLYGMFAMLYLDIFNNWPLLAAPKRDLVKLTVSVVVALCVGLLPYIDNFAHIGGFASGILGGFIFMKTINFSNWDYRRKWLLRLASIPVLAIFWIACLAEFFAGNSDPCPWCIYFDCLPVDAPWCQSST